MVKILFLLPLLLMMNVIKCEPFDAHLQDYNHSSWSSEELRLAPHLRLSEEEREELVKYTEYQVPEKELEVVKMLLHNSTLHELSDMISDVSTTKGAEMIARQMSKIVKSTPEIHDPLMTSLKLLAGDEFTNFHRRLRRSPSICIDGGKTYMGIIIVITGGKPAKPRPPIRKPYWPVFPGPPGASHRGCPPYCGGGGRRPVSSGKMSSSSTQPGGKGETVVDEVTQSVDKFLGDTKGFLKKIAYVESLFGEHSGTYRSGYDGGIFQVDYIGFKDTQNTGSHPGLKAKYGKIQAAWGIDWTKTSWSDMKKPLYSTIAARLLLSNKPGAIPSSLDGQAKYWKRYYNSEDGAGTAAEFVNRWNDYLAKKSKG